MKNINESELTETGHGFIIFERFEEPEEPELINPDWGAITYDQKIKTRRANQYVKAVYLVEGGEAGRIINENEFNQDFWDQVETFYNSEAYDYSSQ